MGIKIQIIRETTEKEIKKDIPLEETSENTERAIPKQKKGLFKALRERFQGISLRNSINTVQDRVKKQRVKTYIVSSQENPNDYEYVEATSASEAIRLSPYENKDVLYAKIKPEYNAYIVDEVVGNYPTYIEPREISEKAGDARMYYFEEYENYLYFLYMKYDATKVNSFYVAWERNQSPKVTPDELYDAITWTDLIKEAFKPKEITTLDKLNPTLLLGLIGCLIFLIIVMQG